MEALMTTMRFIDRALLNILKAVAIVVFVCLTVLISANVFVRFFPVVSLHWFDEIVELIFAALVFYGAAALLQTLGLRSVVCGTTNRDEGARTAACGEHVLGERDQVVGDVGGRDVVDVDAAAGIQKAPEAVEVATVAVECVNREAALDLAVVEEEVDCLVEGEPARHSLIGWLTPRQGK